MYLSLFVIFQFASYNAVPVYQSSSEDNLNEPLSWYPLIRNFERTRHHSYQHPVRRFSNDYFLPERQRRFGNTKYGRSLTIE